MATPHISASRLSGQALEISPGPHPTKKIDLEYWNPAQRILSAIKTSGLTLQLLNEHRDAVVLVLGQDTGKGLFRLRQIQRSILTLGYYGVLIKDISGDEFTQQSLEEKVLTIGSSCAFVLIEDSTASGHLMELSLLVRCRKTVAVLRREGHGSTWMTADYELDFARVIGLSYKSDQLHQAVVKSVDWAEEMHHERELALKSTYPWRHP